MKKVLIVLLFMTKFCCGVDYVAHWKFNDDAATTTVIDETGSHNGTAQQNTADISVAGKIKTALSFNGTTDFISITDHADFSFGDGSADSTFSVSVWVKFDSADDAVEIIGKKATSNREYILFTSSDKLYFRLYDESAGAYLTRITNSYTVPDDEWLHIACTYNANEAVSGLKIYVNSVRKDDTNLTFGSYTAMEGLGQDVWFGRDGSIYSEVEIDNAVIFDKELKQSEINRLHNGGNGTEKLGELDSITRNPRRSTTSPLAARSRYEFY